MRKLTRLGFKISVLQHGRLATFLEGSWPFEVVFGCTIWFGVPGLRLMSRDPKHYSKLLSPCYVLVIPRGRDKATCVSVANGSTSPQFYETLGELFSCASIRWSRDYSTAKLSIFRRAREAVAVKRPAASSCLSVRVEPPLLFDGFYQSLSVTLNIVKI